MTPVVVVVILLCVAMILVGFTLPKPNGWVVFALGLLALLIQVGAMSHLFR